MKQVRCVDNTFQRDVLTVGRVYTVWGETDDCFVLEGLGPFTKARFEVVMSEGKNAPAG